MARAPEGPPARSRAPDFQFQSYFPHSCGAGSKFSFFALCTNLFFPWTKAAVSLHGDNFSTECFSSVASFSSFVCLFCSAQFVSSSSVIGWCVGSPLSRSRISTEDMPISENISISENKSENIPMPEVFWGFWSLDPDFKLATLRISWTPF